MGPIRTLAIVTELKELLESKLVASDQSKMIAPHSIHTLCIPTGSLDEGLTSYATTYSAR